MILERDETSLGILNSSSFCSIKKGGDIASLFYSLIAGLDSKGTSDGGALYLFLEIATITIPSTAIATAGATVSPVVPDKKSHTANAMQMSPTISLSFLTLSIHLPETQADI